MVIPPLTFDSFLTEPRKMPWRPLPRIAFAVATYPFQPSSPADLPLQLGDELYIIEQGGRDGAWFRGYLVAPPSLLSGLTSVKGQTLEARVFSGIFPRSCVDIREELGEVEQYDDLPNGDGRTLEDSANADKAKDTATQDKKSHLDVEQAASQTKETRRAKNRLTYKTSPSLSAISRRSSSQGDDATKSGSGEERKAKPPAPVPMLKIGDETPTSTTEPLVDEIASCLREWHSTNLHELLLNRQYGTVERMSAVVSQLDYARRQFLNDVLTAQERISLRQQTVWNLARGNRMLGGEVIVRDPDQRGRLLTGDDSAIEMTTLQSVMTLLDEQPVTQTEAPTLHHLLLEIKAVSGADPGSTTLSASLYLQSRDGNFTALSETFNLSTPSTESYSNSTQSSRLKTLFTDLSASDIGEKGASTDQKLFLVIKIHASDMPLVTGQVSEPDGQARNSTLRGKASEAASSAQDTLRRGRGSLVFGSKRKPGFERVKQLSQSGRFTPQPDDRASTPVSRDGPSPEPQAKPKPKAQPVVRTVGIGILELSEVIRQNREEDQVLSIWTAATTNDDFDQDAPQENSAISKILHSSTQRYIPCQRASQVQVRLHHFPAASSKALIAANPTILYMVTETEKIGFSEAPTQARSDIYITFSDVSIPPNSFLSHPELGFYPIKTEPLLNLQLTMEVRDESGQRIEHCIYPSSNSLGITAWRTHAAELQTLWDQTICLRIPPEKVPGSHLIMSVADAPQFPFALAWLPLWESKAFVHDGKHSLIMHGYDKTTSSVVQGKGAYLSLPWNIDDERFVPGHDGVTVSVATLNLETRLCSTEYSQNPVIISLVNWKQQTSVQLYDLLKKLVFVPEIEIIKQVNDVFDSLFAILVHKAGDSKFEDLIFNDIVAVLGFVQDRRFNLGPVIEQYSDDHFNSPYAAPSLVRSWTRLMQSVSDAQSARDLRALLKVGGHMLRFIITSHRQHRPVSTRSASSKNSSSFKTDTQAIFFGLQMMLRSKTPGLVGNKTLLVQHFHTWLPELLAAFSKEEVARIAFEFVESIGDATGKLVLYKLVLILHIIEFEELWSEPLDRKLLIRNCLHWLSPYWGETKRTTEHWHDQVRLCCSVVAELLKNPTPQLYNFMPKIIGTYLTITANPPTKKSSLALLFSKSYPFQTKQTDQIVKFDEALLELSALMSTISRMPPIHSMELGEQDMSTYILSVLEAQKSILEYDAYPQTWLSLSVYHHRSAMRILENVANLLTSTFLPTPDYAERFDMQLWKAFFMTLLKLVGSDTLALETFPEQKRRAVWRIAGDVRESGADLLRLTWQSIGWESSTDDQRRYNLSRLGGYQVQYVPSLVSPIVELCLSPHEGLRRVAVEILQTMIVSEWALSEDLVLIETEMIASLDVIFKTKNVSDSVTQKLFIGELLDLFEPIASQPDDALWVALKECVTVIDELMDLLVAAHGDSVEAGLNMLKLMDFMRDMQKEDLFISYVHDLALDQERLHNHTEAGLALQLHADLYPWDTGKMLPALKKPVFSEQSAFDRKEALYFRIIQNFEDGKAWLPALKHYKELAGEYEHTTFDFAKLARTQRAMGKINEAISKEERHAPRYFRVAYRGLGFPPHLRDRQFIFEGSPSERMAVFIDRMQKQYPTAQVGQGAKDGSVEGQYLEVSSVSAFRDVNHPVYRRARLTSSTRDHLLLSSPQKFSVSAKRHTRALSLNEQGVDKLVYTTADPFPTILRKSEIVSSETVHLSPLEAAIERTWRKTAELLTLERKAALGDDPNSTEIAKFLLQLLDVDSATAASPALYQRLLPKAGVKSERRRSDPVDDEDSLDEDDEPPRYLGSPLETALYVALSDHAVVIKRCLQLFARPSLQATRRDLNSRFESVYPQSSRLSTPPLRGEKAANHRRSLSFDDIPPESRRDGDAGDNLQPFLATTNGRVQSPESDFTSSSGRLKDKSHRISLQYLKKSLMSDSGKGTSKKNSPVVTRPTSPPTMHHNINNMSLSSSIAPSNGNGRGFMDSSGAVGTTRTHDEMNGLFKPSSSLLASVYDEVAAADRPRTPAPLDDNAFGRNLTDSLGANINIGGRFDRPSTATSHRQYLPSSRSGTPTAYNNGIGGPRFLGTAADSRPQTANSTRTDTTSRKRRSLLNTIGGLGVSLSAGGGGGGRRE